jgi:two-component system, chemotaxis family, protein-glutamate methylesterase/glutaminase
MDAVMPQMNGLEATREIMCEAPTRIIMISSSQVAGEASFALEAIRAGALTVIPKPIGFPDAQHLIQVNELLSTIRLMADVEVIHHWKRSPGEPRDVKRLKPRPEIVGIVASTGGPAALSQIVFQLPADFQLSMVIVQHIAADFVQSLAGWLATKSPLRVEIARQGNRPQPGVIYLAPGEAHLSLNTDRRFALDETAGGTQHMPSGDVMLNSLVGSYGAEAIGVILTGMGSDGAQGLKALHEAGAFTIAQDEESCVVFGMPREAMALGAVSVVLPLDEIGKSLMKVARGDGV